MCKDDEGRVIRRVYYISPCGTIERLTPESLEGDLDYMKDMISPNWYERPEDGE